MLLKRIAICLLAAVALITGACATAQKQEITPTEFLDHIKYLASDALKGRGNGTPELDKAADYIRAEFRKAGLRPMPDGFYYQYFNLRTGSRLGAANSLEISTPRGERVFSLRRDYVPVSFGAEQARSLPLVFAGYGITAPEFQYDDYEGLDVTGKAVLVFALEPQRDQDDSPFDGRADTVYATIQSKVLNARNKGAAALLIVTGPLHGRPDRSELPSIASGYRVDEMGIPAAVVNREILEDALADSGIDLAELQNALEDDLRPRSRAVEGYSVTLEVDCAPINRRVANVAGLIPGSDPRLAEEVIIIGAHYDHLGLGERGSMAPDEVGQVHNGADDNASGVAGLIEIAERMSLDMKAPRRTLVFVAFAGEELGVLGSTSFTHNPPFPRENIIAMLNMDMIGRPRERSLLVGGVGTAAEFRGIVEEANRNIGFKLSFEESGISASDHTPFTMIKIPVLFFFSGVHMDYHKPSDDWQKINAAGGADVARLVAAVARRIDGLDRRPQFVEVEQPQMPPAGKQQAGAGAWFGSVPDFSFQGSGYRFQAVLPGSPAAEAGLQAGDVMIEFGGKKVGNIYDYTAALRSFQPGDEVEVAVMRADQEIRVKVILKARSRR